MERLGERFKRIRLEKGFSLDDVHKRTKIHINILKAIEEDSLVNFSPIYIKGFLKIYCKYLGVELKDFIPDYKEPRSFTNKPQGAVSKKKDLSRIKTVFTAVLILTLLSLGLFKLGKFVSHRTILLSKKKKLAVSVSKPANPQPAAPKGQAVEIKASPITNIHLVIKAKDSCWIKLKTDGKIVFQNKLKKGRSESWQAKERIELSLSNAAAVDLEVNGKLFSNLGRKNKVLKNVVITKEGLKILQ